MYFGYLRVSAPVKTSTAAFMFNWTGIHSVEPGMEKEYMEGNVRPRVTTLAAVRARGEEPIPGEIRRATIPILTTINVSHQSPYVIVGKLSEFRELQHRAAAQQIRIDPGSATFLQVRDVPLAGATGSAQERALLRDRPVLQRQPSMQNIALRSGLFYSLAPVEKEMMEHVKKAALEAVGMVHSAAAANVGGVIPDLATHALPLAETFGLERHFAGKGKKEPKYQLMLFLHPTGKTTGEKLGVVREVADPIAMRPLLQDAFQHWPHQSVLEQVVNL